MDPFDRDSRLDAVRRYVTDNLDSAISLKQVAGHAGISRTYLSKLFRRKVGIGFHDWLIAQRIAVAQALFREKDLSVTQAAFASGFGSLSAFERAFKRHTKLTPRQFRNNVRQACVDASNQYLLNLDQ